MDNPVGPPFLNVAPAALAAEMVTRIKTLRRDGKLAEDALLNLRHRFRIRNIFHSNAIEGNALNEGETRMVVRDGLTLSGKSLRDQLEAKNLDAALEYVETLASEPRSPITETDLRQLHQFVLKGVDDQNAGRYRRGEVQISGSNYLPPGPESVPSEMGLFGSWLAANTRADSQEDVAHGIISAAIAHTWLVIIHPFVDGNGRVARLLMNLVLMRAGVPIAIITHDDRPRYIDALEQAQESDMSPFLSLLSDCIEEGLDLYEEEISRAKEQNQRVAALVASVDRRAEQKQAKDFEVWKSAMTLLRAHMAAIADKVSEQSTYANVGLRDFGHLDFDKYRSLRQGEGAKKTWFFRTDFRSAERIVRYLFFFGRPSRTIRDCGCKVSLWIAREHPDGSYHYDKLDNLQDEGGLEIREFGYVADKESFVVRRGPTKKQEGRVEELGAFFYASVFRRHFEID